MSCISSPLVGVYLKDSIMNSSAKQYVTWIQTDRGPVPALPLTDCVTWVRDLSSQGLSVLIYVTDDCKDEFR